jgi:hypothetical protein
VEDDHVQEIESIVSDLRALKEANHSADFVWNGLREVMMSKGRIDIGEMPTVDERWALSEASDLRKAARIAFHIVFIGKTSTREDLM